MRLIYFVSIFLVGCTVYKPVEVRTTDTLTIENIKDCSELVKSFKKTTKAYSKKINLLSKDLDKCRKRRVKYKYIQIGSRNKNSKEIEILNKNIDSLTQIVSDYEAKKTTDKSKVVVRPVNKIKKGISFWWLIVVFILGYFVRYLHKD